MTSTKPRLDELPKLRAQSLGRLLLLARRNFLARSTQLMQKNGFDVLSNSFTTLLPHIDLEGTRSIDLAQRSGLTKQAVAKAVKELEADGMLAREPDPSDKRAFLVKLTHLGVARLQETHIVIRQIEEEYARTLGVEGRESLRAALTALVYGDETAETAKNHTKEVESFE